MCATTTAIAHASAVGGKGGPSIKILKKVLIIKLFIYYSSKIVFKSFIIPFIFNLTPKDIKINFVLKTKINAINIK